MIPFKKEDINKKYSPTWVYCNDNTRSKIFREKFVKEFGGEFIKESRYSYKWQEIKKKPKRKFIFEDRDGTVYVVENMYDFCKKNNLKRPALYEVVVGKRKSHRGYRFIAEI
jgi:hypothetical protein